MHPHSHTSAVLLENFSIFYEDDDTELNRSAVKDFKQNWFYFDKKATGKISSLRVKLFLRMLRIKEFYTYSINENGVKVSKVFIIKATYTSTLVCSFVSKINGLGRNGLVLS